MILLALLIIFFQSAITPQANTIKDIQYKDVNLTDYEKQMCKLDIYYPLDTKDFFTIIWFHGGGLTGGSKEIPEGLMNKGYAIVGAGYRFSPHVNSPAYIEDAAAAIAYVFRNIENYGGNRRKIILSGFSAGGYLSLMCGLNKQFLGKHNIDADSIAAIIPCSGQTITHFTIRKERGIPETQAVVDSLAPLFWARIDASPLYLITGDRELELFGRYEENAYLKRMMKLCGHEKTELYELEGFNHGEMVVPALNLINKLVNHLKK